MNAMAQLLPLLLAPTGGRPACHAAADWLPHWRAVQAAHTGASPFGAAVASARQADRLAWAFFSGYQGALQASFGAARGCLGTFCVNEAGRRITEIATSVTAEGDRLRLQGSKSWALAGLGDLTLYVLARRADGPASGPGSLVVVQVPSTAPGVQFEAARPQGMVPEMPHASVRLESVVVSAGEQLPGDGYAGYAKPFRLREDVFVTGAVLAWLLGEAEAHAWPAAWCERALAAIALLDACSRLEPSQADTILGVAGALALAGELVEQSESLWTAAQQDARERWLRDRKLLAIGQEARGLRAAQAWAALGRAAS